MDAEMGKGSRSMGIFYWSPAEPGLVGTITVVVNPGRYDEIKTALESVLTSVRIETGGEK